MIGVSLLPYLLNDKVLNNPLITEMKKVFGETADDILSFFSSCGVKSIELRAIFPGSSPEENLKVCNKIWNHKLNVTVHGSMLSSESAIDNVIKPLELVLKNCKQDYINVTLHSLKYENRTESETINETINALKNLSYYSKKNSLPLRFSLEINRYKADKADNADKGDPGYTCDTITRILKEVNSDIFGICWDFGHYLYNLRNFTNNEKALPPDNFLKNVTHTHIHGIVNNSTHFPLSSESMPALKDYCNAIKNVGYNNVFNIELEPARFFETLDIKESYVNSIEELKKYAY